LLSFVESAPRAYRLKASNAAPPISTSIGTIPLGGTAGRKYLAKARTNYLRRIHGSLVTSLVLLYADVPIVGYWLKVKIAVC
jgi:hypothetical protein